MLGRFTDFRIPTDGRYAFHLKPVDARRRPGVSDVRDIAREVLLEGDAERFAQRIARWSGPEDRDASGAQPYVAQQLLFDDRMSTGKLALADLEDVLRGTVRVLHDGDRVEYILRDHHTLDVVLYHYATTGELPSSMFHADRHSDWCTDGFLEQRVPDQAATWWKLLHGIKRPGGAPVLDENQVFFATAKAEHQSWMSGSDVGAATRVPWFLDAKELAWEHSLAREGVDACDWVSLDLDYFQPSPQLRLAGPLLRDARFARMWRSSRVRLYVLSPQFTNGGEKLKDWEVMGSVSSSLRLVNLLRAG